MELETQTLTLNTKGFNDIIDITTRLQRLLNDGNYDEGRMLVFVPGATAGLTTIEYEGGLIQDMKDFFDRISPMESHYHHNDRWHDGNGYAHVRAAMLKPDLTIPFVHQRLCLGTWQQVVLIDFDNRPRNREVVVQICGKKH